MKYSKWVHCIPKLNLDSATKEESKIYRHLASNLVHTALGKEGEGGRGEGGERSERGKGWGRRSSSNISTSSNNSNSSSRRGGKIVVVVVLNAFYFFIFLFYFGVCLIYNVVLVSGTAKWFSYTYTYIYSFSNYFLI